MTFWCGRISNLKCIENAQSLTSNLDRECTFEELKMDQNRYLTGDHEFSRKVDMLTSIIYRL